jgi:hypothetical protein
LFGTTMIMVSVALVMSVIVTNIHLRKDSADSLPQWLRSYLRRQQLKQQGVSSSIASTTGSAAMATTRRRSGPGAEGSDGCASGLGMSLIHPCVPSEAENASFSDTEHRIWQKRKSQVGTGSAHDDHGPSGRGNHVTHYRETNGNLGLFGAGMNMNNATYNGHHAGHSPRTCRASLGESGDKCHQKMLASAEEWHTLACLVDRIFFWLFLVTSVVTLSAMYLAIPSY